MFNFGLTLPDLKTYYKDTVIKTVRYLHKDRSAQQWNKLEKSDTDAHIYGQLIFNKDTKAIQWSQRQSFQQMIL